LINTSAQVGGALGLAVLATLSATRTDNLLASGSSDPVALVGGFQLALIIAGSILVLGTLVTITVIRGGAPSPAHAHEGHGAESQAPAFDAGQAGLS
jgi:hypothetical protein